MTDNLFDFNNAGEQRSFDVIPAGTIATLQMTIRPGNAGEDGWLRTSGNGQSEGLDCEFIVVDGQFAKKKLWQLFTLRGPTDGHAEAGKISLNTLRAILESARGIKPADTSEAAQAARKIKSWADLDQIRFVARLGVRPPQDNYPAKNFIQEVITPDRQAWTKPEQLLSVKSAPASPTSTPPANAITRPQWA